MPVFPERDLKFADLPGRRSADPLGGLSWGDCSMRIVDVPFGARRTPHRHPFSSELIYVLSGSGVAWEDGRRTDVRAGDVIAVRQGMAHATIATAVDGLRLVCFFPHNDLGGNLEELNDEIAL